MSSVSFSSVSSQANVDNLLKDLECPVSLELYEDPVQLDCSHSLSRKSAEGIYGKMKGNIVERPGRCPSGCANVKSYKDNIALRNIVDAIRKNGEALSLIPKRLAYNEYPGDRTEFRSFGNWRVLKDANDISRVRHCALMGDRKSFVQFVFIYGHENNTLSVLIDCFAVNEKKEIAIAFFRRLDPSIGVLDSEKTTFLVKTDKGLDWAFAFLTENNTFQPDCKLPLLTRFFQEKKWRHIEEELNLIRPRTPRGPSLLPPALPSNLPPALPLTLPPSLSQAPTKVASLARSMEGKLQLTPPRQSAFEQKNPPAYELKAVKTERKGYVSNMQVEG